MNTIYRLNPIPPLTAAEKATPYAKLYDIPISDPPPDVLGAFAIGNQIDPSLSIGIGDFERFFLPDGLPCYNGYCMMPDGTGYFTVSVELPNATVEMNEIWDSGWIRENDVNYKTWFPGFHVTHKDPTKEDVGYGVVVIDFGAECAPVTDYLSAAPEVLDPRYITFFGGGPASFIPDGWQGEAFPHTVISRVTKSDRGGLRIQNIGWCGKHLINGKEVRAIPEGKSVNPEWVRLLACHMAYEDQRKNDIFPKIAEIKHALENTK